jgi:tellurite resistance protein TerC
MLLLVWLGFVLFILTLLALDLGVFNRKAHVVSVREALGWSTVWISLGLAFSVFVYFAYSYNWFDLGLARDGTTAIDPVDKMPLTGAAAAVKYLTGYVIEESLSVDNIFVIAVIIGYFKVPAIYQHRVLYWGILGALVMRGAMIGLGHTLITRFHWIIYVFGAFLVITAIRMLTLKESHDDPGDNKLVKLARKLFPVTKDYHGKHFFVRADTEAAREAAMPSEDGKSHADPVVEKTAEGAVMLTPLMLALIVIETTDLIFAVDSIPAIFAITGDPFLVFTSNVFAVLGLRSLYFALAGAITAFRYLKVALAIVLLVVGTKMLLADLLKDYLGQHFNLYLLGLVFAILGAGVIASIVANRRDARNGVVPAH